MFIDLWAGESEKTSSGLAFENKGLSLHHEVEMDHPIT